jgi:hypothetical protein
MFQFFALLSSYLFVRSLREKRLVLWMAFVGSSILMMYTHLYGALVLAALVVYALIYRRRYRIPAFWIAGAAAAILISYMPWIARISGGGPSDIRNYPTQNGVLPRYLLVHWYTFFNTMDVFNNGISPRRWWAFAAGAGLFSLPAALALKKTLLRSAGDSVAQRLDKEGTAINAILWSFPLFLGLGAGALGLPYNARYVLFCAAPYYILVAYGISVLENSALRHGLIMLIVAYSGYSIAEAFSQRTDGARRIMAHVESNVRTGDCGAFLWVVTSPPSWLAMWDSSSAAPLAPVPTARVDRLSFRLIPQTTLPAAFVPCLRIWVFKVPEPDLGPPAQEMKHLDEEAMRFVGPTHKKVEEFSDAGLSVSLYSANATRESRKQAL